MQVRISTDAPLRVGAGAIVVPVFSDGSLDGLTRSVDDELGGAISEILANGEITGKSGELALVHAHDKPVKRVLAVGLGERAKLNPEGLVKYAGAAVRHLGRRGVKEIAVGLPTEAGAFAREAASFVVEGAITATLDPTIYRTEIEKPIVVDAVTVVATGGGFDRAALEAGARRGEILGEAVNVARRLALTPANDMTPTILAERARELAERHGLGVEILDEARMKELGMGALLGVSRGSDEPATMTILRYDGDPSSNERLALVGKGITFDSGGISIKPAENMHEMKYDMSGGAAVIAAMSAIAQLKPKLNVIGIVPASENLPGPRAVKPGDILKAMNGKTIEVINTDAEGRLILADALAYANTLGATRIVDAATLTGAMVVALGHAATGTISSDDAFVEQFLRVANATGERYWHLPLYDDYSTAVKSEIADLRNSTGRPAGSLTAAAFLKNFVGETPWIHLDIAGTAYVDESAGMAKGPTGTPVRAFVALVEELAKNGAASDAAATNGRQASAAVTAGRT